MIAMSNDKVQIYRGEDGDWYFRRVAPNGEVGNPSQGYGRRRTAVEGAIRWNRDVWREHFVDITRGGVRVRSVLLEKVPSKADDGA